jgi:hypothetical protein
LESRPSNLKSMIIIYLTMKSKPFLIQLNLPCSNSIRERGRSWMVAFAGIESDDDGNTEEINYKTYNRRFQNNDKT